jgi:peptidyl-prolyl cis-trans isomerase D
LAGVESPRQIIQWAFNTKTKKGNVSDVFEFPDKYVIDTVADIREEEYATFDQKKKEIEMLVKRDKKAEQIIAKIKSAGSTSIDQLATKLSTRVESSSNVSFAMPSIQNLGFEPNLLAAVVNTPANVMSAPIKGENGVYVIVVNSVTENPVSDPTYSMQLTRISRNYMSRVNYGLMDALEKTANVEDNRSNFF